MSAPVCSTPSVGTFPPKMAPRLWCPGIRSHLPMARDLILALPCWEQSGKVLYDYSGNGRTTTKFTTPTWQISDLGWSLHFDGTTGVIDLPALPSVVDFTVSLWFTTIDNNNDGGSPYSVLFWASNSAGTETIQISPANQANQNFYLSVDAGTNGNLCYIFNDNCWYHVAMVRQGATVYCYVNGIKIGSFNVGSATDSFNWVNPQIGARNDSGTNSAFFPGNISNLLIYNRALTDSEVLNLFDYPWSIYQPIELTAQSTISTLTGLGGVTVGGSALISDVEKTTSSGGVTVGGTAPFGRLYEIKGSGGINVGGQSTVHTWYRPDYPINTIDGVIAGSGVKAGGSATNTAVFKTSPSGGVKDGGQANVNTAHNYSFTSDGSGVTTSGVGIGLPNFTFHGDGVINMSGACDVSKVYYYGHADYPGSQEQIFITGEAEVTKNFFVYDQPDLSEPITMGGEADVIVTYNDVDCETPLKCGVDSPNLHTECFKPIFFNPQTTNGVPTSFRRRGAFLPACTTCHQKGHLPV